MKDRGGGGQIWRVEDRALHLRLGENGKKEAIRGSVVCECVCARVLAEDVRSWKAKRTIRSTKDHRARGRQKRRKTDVLFDASIRIMYSIF